MKDEAENLENSKTTVNPYLALDDDDQLAIDMLVNHYSYADISKKFKVKIQTVYDWFAKGGRLHEGYKYQRKLVHKQYKKNFKQIDQEIKDGAVDAIKTIRRAATKANMPGIVAARDILDRAGFKPKDKVDIDVKGVPTKVELTILKRKDDKPTDSQNNN